MGCVVSLAIMGIGIHGSWPVVSFSDLKTLGVKTFERVDLYCVPCVAKKYSIGTRY